MNGKSQTVVATAVLALLGWIVIQQQMLQANVGDLRERMARLEGRVDMLVNVFAEQERAKP